MESRNKLVPIWLDMQISNLFRGTWEKPNLLLMARLIEVAPCLGKLPKETFLAEMLAAQINLLGFVCDRLSPEFNAQVARLVQEAQRRINLELYKKAVGEALKACTDMARGYATNPILGHRTLALAVATRLDFLHFQMAVKLLTEEFQRLESAWEEEFRVVLLDQYDKENPADVAKATSLRVGLTRHLLNHSIQAIALPKPRRA